MGTGKTTNAVAIAYWMRELFELPVISVGTTVGLTDKFGAFTHVSTKVFIEQMMLMATIANEIIEHKIAEDDVDTYLRWCKETRGLLLYRCIILVDEFYKLCDARNPSNRLNLAFLTFIAQMRHYHCTLLCMTPNPRNVDSRVRDQLRWHCRPDRDPDEDGVYNLRFQGPDGKLFMKINGPDYAGRYPKDPERMFNSWAFTGFNIKSLEKVLAKDV